MEKAQKMEQNQFEWQEETVIIGRPIHTSKTIEIIKRGKFSLVVIDL